MSHSTLITPPYHRMSVSRIIVSIVIVTYGSYASFLDKEFNKISLSPYYDTLGDYYVEDPLLETYSEDADPQDSDYADNNWEHDSEIIGRQLPESGEFKLNQDKKSQIWCKVKKVIKHHHEPGYEFFPKSYSEYDCLPHTNFDGSSENSIFSSDVCPVHHGRCISIQKQYYFLKRKKTEKCWKLAKETLKDMCAIKDVKCRPLQKTFIFFKWPSGTKSLCSLIKVEKTVKVGCNCVNHVKYHFQ